jgi:stress-induced morphogen
MNTSCEKIRHLLESEFQPEDLQIEDESWKHAGHAGARESGGGHFIVHITTDQFAGNNLPEKTGRNAIGWFTMYSNLCSLQPSMP